MNFFWENITTSCNYVGCIGSVRYMTCYLLRKFFEWPLPGIWYSQKFIQ